MSFDISIAFDDAKYLDPQIYLFINTLKDNIPKDTYLHVTTTREHDDPLLEYIMMNIDNSLYYQKPRYPDLKSRCQYLLRTVEVDTEADWLIKMDLDILFLNHLKMLYKTLDDEFDIIIQSENRRIIQNDNMETRVWRNIYRAMGIQMPDIKIPYIESGEMGRPLLNTGVFMIKTEHLDYIKANWSTMTKICENWIELNIHPNEFALTGLVFHKEWDLKLFNRRYNFNPISWFRQGAFPSTVLKPNCKIPKDVLVLHYHRAQWLKHLSNYNGNIKSIIEHNKEYIPDEWWDVPIETYNEKI